MMVRATLISMILTTSGIFLSWIFDIPSGSTIILLGVVVYLLVLGGGSIARGFRKDMQNTD
jgi:zinc transport system permease protein